MYDEKRKSSIIGKIFTIAFVVALVSFLIFLGIQLYRSTIFDYFDEVFITDKLESALENNEDIRTHSVGTEGLGEQGVIKITELVYIKELDKNGKETGLGYIQFGVRYNKTHIDEVNSKIKGDNVKGVSYDDVSYELIAYDYVTTENEKKELQEVARYSLSGKCLLDQADKYQYRYYKFECDGVLLNCESLEIEMKIHGVEMVNSNGESYMLEKDGAETIVDSDPIHTKDRTSIEYEFSKSEKKKLEE